MNLGLIRTYNCHKCKNWSRLGSYVSNICDKSCATPAAYLSLYVPYDVYALLLTLGCDTNRTPGEKVICEITTQSQIYFSFKSKKFIMPSNFMHVVTLETRTVKNTVGEVSHINKHNHINLVLNIIKMIPCFTGPYMTATSSVLQLLLPKIHNIWAFRHAQSSEYLYLS